MLYNKLRGVEGKPDFAKVYEQLETFLKPFIEGNDQLFAIKYLRQLGFEIDNEPFKNHSRFFRDSLALANYHKRGKKDEYLRMFTENTLLNGHHKLEIEHIF